MLDSNIHPLDWRNLEKGSSISETQIREFWHYHYPDKDFNERTSWMVVKGKIQDLRTSINAPLVIRQVTKENTTSFEILTDKEAPDYLSKQATAGVRKQRANARRLLTDIDVDNLDESERRKLETKQIHHAFIAAAADGARKQSLQATRKGQTLPKSVIKTAKLIPPDY